MTRLLALLREAEAAATPGQAAKTVSAAQTLRLSLDRRGTSVFGRSPSRPGGRVGNLKLERNIMTKEELITLRTKATNAEADLLFKSRAARALAVSVDATGEEKVDADIEAEKAMIRSVNAAAAYRQGLVDYIASEPVEVEA